MLKFSSENNDKMRFQILLINFKSVHYLNFFLGPKVEIAVFFDIISLVLLYLPVFTSAERSKKQQKTAIYTLGPWWPWCMILMFYFKSAFKNSSNQWSVANALNPRHVPSAQRKRRGTSSNTSFLSNKDFSQYSFHIRSTNRDCGKPHRLQWLFL